MARSGKVWVFADPEIDPEESAGEQLHRLGCDVVMTDLRDPLVQTILPRSDVGLIFFEAISDVALAYRASAELPRELQVLPMLLALSVDGLGRTRARDGFDDIVLYPYVPAELYLRIRRLQWRDASYIGASDLKLGELEIDMDAHEVRVRGRSVELTKQEFSLLAFLLFNPNRVHAREQILRQVWGASFAHKTRTVDIHVRRLRQKLGEYLPLETVRGVGYRVRVE